MELRQPKTLAWDLGSFRTAGFARNASLIVHALIAVGQIPKNSIYVVVAEAAP